MNDQSAKVFSVDEINTRLQAIIHNETIGNAFWTGGVIKQLAMPESGHIYFNLVDDPFSIRCFLKKDLRGNLSFTVSNNIEVEVYGEIRVYDKRASIEINVEKIRLIEQSLIPPNPIDVDNYLIQKGLVGLKDYKSKPIPKKIGRIYLLTGQSSKALDDFKHTYYRKTNHKTSADIIHEEIPLKGETAPQQIAEAIQRVNALSQPNDVIVITRGGGRKSELSTFNDLKIAEAMRQSKIPIITGIGHEKDSVLVDKLADKSAITPTDAADKLIEAQRQSFPCLPILSVLITLLSVTTSLVLLNLIFVIEI